VLPQELPHEGGDPVNVFLQREVAGVERAELDGLQVLFVRLGPCRWEDGVVLTPGDEGRRLVFAEVVLPKGVLCWVAGVAVEQRQLDLLVAGPVEERLIDGPGVGADRLYVADPVRVLPRRKSPKRCLCPRTNSVPAWVGSASSTAAFWKAQPRNPGDSNHSFRAAKNARDGLFVF
jgi:hypothetical protein